MFVMIFGVLILKYFKKLIRDIGYEKSNIEVNLVGIIICFKILLLLIFDDF